VEMERSATDLSLWVDAPALNAALEGLDSDSDVGPDLISNTGVPSNASRSTSINGEADDGVRHLRCPACKESCRIHLPSVPNPGSGVLRNLALRSVLEVVTQELAPHYQPRSADNINTQRWH